MITSKQSLASDIENTLVWILIQARKKKNFVPSHSHLVWDNNQFLYPGSLTNIIFFSWDLLLLKFIYIGFTK